ncbi:hypothetical protein GP2143_17101 [marine gamma proteobacterium HTCC2143]|uniref:Uncharacterized protein n=1 Tax=marine gamma proteobacterium HTCC2143 TaxID=247633 RepID=A0YA40_9GAMM|nr:hypothetical protein GP2143_17101 [marine gamma proteobacterium HTCC2143]
MGHDERNAGLNVELSSHFFGIFRHMTCGFGISDYTGMHGYRDGEKN